MCQAPIFHMRIVGRMEVVNKLWVSIHGKFLMKNQKPKSDEPLKIMLAVIVIIFLATRCIVDPGPYDPDASFWEDGGR